MRCEQTTLKGAKGAFAVWVFPEATPVALEMSPIPDKSLKAGQTLASWAVTSITLPFQSGNMITDSQEGERISRVRYTWRYAVRDCVNCFTAKRHSLVG